ncbi:hypothetical protein [Methylobacterium tarhaniae]|uniref:hypothetical protein n=1 Tax=Methylobacterium tarhaniae TaxID=1187852 RepID=UPI003CFCE140
MAQKVRFKRDWEFWPRPGVVMMYAKGEEKRLPQAQVDAALADKAAELVDPQAKPEDDTPAASDNPST